MKTKTVKKWFKILNLFLAVSMLIVSCKRDPCKDVTCQNGGTPVSSDKTCACNCPAGYQGEFCQTKVDFVKCKINGVDYQSVKIIIDTVAGSTGKTYRRITTSGNLSDSEIIIIHFYSSLPAGTYTSADFAEGDFVGTYIAKQAYEYYSTRGTLVLTTVTGRYEGSFNFTGVIDPSSPQDSVVVTSGSFSIKK